MSKNLRTIFLVHAIVSLVFGLPMLIVPGRFLTLFDWARIDPVVSRLFGAALLAFAWSSYRGWRDAGSQAVKYLVEVEAVFTVMACVGLLRHLLFFSNPIIMWLIFALLVLFAVAWVYSWFQLSRKTPLVQPGHKGMPPSA